MRSVELFAGAGGLGIAASRAGFEHAAVIEIDTDACKTLMENQKRGVDPINRWPIFQADVRNFDFSMVRGVDLVAGGPPCQPFSRGGRHRGRNDRRDMFPEAIRVVGELRPRAVLFENVKGLVRESFSDYFEYIRLQLGYVSAVRGKGESWTAHLRRLRRWRKEGEKPDYDVHYALLNAADYGVAQKRERVFIVAFRSDLEVEWVFPGPSHSLGALLKEQWVTGTYWDRHRVPRARRPELPRTRRTLVDRLRTGEIEPAGLPWTTTRDRIADLPNPRRKNGLPNHVFVDGARPYPGHSGSQMDEPAKTLKAGDHGVPGGENMVVEPDGRVRYFTVREAARLQDFPDEQIFPCAWTEAMRQIGNAVPVGLATTVLSAVFVALRACGSSHGGSRRDQV